MNLRAFALTLMLAFSLLLLLVTLNWTAFAAPTALSLGFTEISAPLGMVALVFTAVVSALFVVYIVFQQAGVILDARRFAKEGKVQRVLGAHMEQSERGLQNKLAEATRTTSAYLDEIEDKLDRVLAPVHS